MPDSVALADKINSANADQVSTVGRFSLVHLFVSASGDFLTSLRLLALPQATHRVLGACAGGSVPTGRLRAADREEDPRRGVTSRRMYTGQVSFKSASSPLTAAVRTADRPDAAGPAAHTARCGKPDFGQDSAVADAAAQAELDRWLML
jgi:hypothetical protein